MNYELFVARVELRGDVSREHAEVLIQATLRTLAERISGEEAHDLADVLLEELQAPLTEAGDAPDAFPVDEFVRRVADRAGQNLDTAAAGARATMITLREAVPRSDFDDITAQLPNNFIDLLGAVTER